MLFLRFLLRRLSLLRTPFSHTENRHLSLLFFGQTWRCWGYLLIDEELVWSEKLELLRRQYNELFFYEPSLCSHLIKCSLLHWKCSSWTKRKRWCSHFRLDSQSFSCVHAQSASSTSEAVAFWSVLFAIAWFAVDLIDVDGHCRAV